MNNLKAYGIAPRPASALKHALAVVGFSFAAAAFSTQAQAACQYAITAQWNNGFTAAIRITNPGTTAIDGWQINWQYTGVDRITSGWSSNMTGSNPYSASNLSWNKTIYPKQTIEFGVQGTKGAADAEVPVLRGTVCDLQAASSASSVASSAQSVTPSSSSVASSSVASSIAVSSSSSRASSSAATTAAWTLDTTASYLNFVTTKNTHNVEAHSFTGLSGDISAAGVATLTIDLDTVSTGVAIRNQRMRDLLFQTAQFPTATVTVTVPSTLISGLAVGQAATTDISASLNLHGVVAPITTKVSVQKLSANRVLVQSLSPILTKASDYSLTSGVEALREAAGLASISIAVPVDFALVFDAR